MDHRQHRREGGREREERERERGEIWQKDEGCPNYAVRTESGHRPQANPQEEEREEGTFFSWCKMCRPPGNDEERRAKRIWQMNKENRFQFVLLMCTDLAHLRTNAASTKRARERELLFSLLILSKLLLLEFLLLFCVAVVFLSARGSPPKATARPEFAIDAAAVHFMVSARRPRLSSLLPLLYIQYPIPNPT